MKDLIFFFRIPFRLLLLLLLLCMTFTSSCGDDSSGSSVQAGGTTVQTDGTYGDRTDYIAVSLISASASYISAGTETFANYLFSSTASDSPALAAKCGGSLTVTGSKVNKTGATSNRENSGFYGFNSGVLAMSSTSTTAYSAGTAAAAISMTDCTIYTNSAGSNGAFAFGERASVTLDHVTIITEGSDNSRGVDATYGGTVTITNSTISTLGGSCAALATDRYNGASAPKVIASNCQGTTAGTGSPGIYCTGTFTVTGCTLNATGSEAACIEGLNSITLQDTSMSGAAKWGVIIYQSMSGDSSLGTGTFTMTGGTLTNGYSSGPMFFVCNTDAVINLNGAALVNSSDMLLVAGKASTASGYIGNVNSSWGTDGGTVTFTAAGQTLSGKIILCDSSSSLAMTLGSSSSYSGAINTGNIACTASLTLDSTSSWTVTGVSYLTGLTDADAGYSNISSAYNVYVNGATASSYTTSVTLSGGGILYIKS